MGSSKGSNYAYRQCGEPVNWRRRAARLWLLGVLVLFPHSPASAVTTIVALGDSLTAGYGISDPASAFPQQLERALRAAGIDARVINAGVSGDTTSGGLARLDWSVADNTDLVILELGANDALRGVAPPVTAANLGKMLASLAAKRTPVLLAGMLAPPNLGAEYGRAFGGIFPALADKYRVPLYPFFLDGVAAQQQFLQADAMHPNAKGVEVIVEKILPYVLHALGAGPRPPDR